MTTKMTAALNLIREAAAAAGVAVQAVSVAQGQAIIVSGAVFGLPESVHAAIDAAAKLAEIDTDQVRLCPQMPNAAIDQ